MAGESSMTQSHKFEFEEVVNLPALRGRTTSKPNSAPTPLGQIIIRVSIPFNFFIYSDQFDSFEVEILNIGVSILAVSSCSDHILASWRLLRDATTKFEDTFPQI